MNRKTRCHRLLAAIALAVITLSHATGCILRDCTGLGVYGYGGDPGQCEIAPLFE